jgi:antitoxin component YwqK of YwqJK toxin-antitoxin module
LWALARFGWFSATAKTEEITVKTLAWQQMVLSPGGACGLLSPMKGFVFFLTVAMVAVGCGGGDAPPAEQAEMPKPTLPDNITITPVAEVAPSTGEADKPGKLTLGKPPKETLPEVNPTPKPNPETKLQGGEAVAPKESVTTAKVEGEANLTKENGQYTAGGSPFEGQFVDHHDNGTKSVDGEFANGKQQGVWTFYHENGKLFRTGKYIDGRADGQWAIWRDDGSKWSAQTYINGQLNGVETRWHPNGQKQSEATWQGGKTIAKEEWNEQGVPKQ